MNSNYKLLMALGMSVVLSSCTLNEGDPQTTICQKLTAHLMNASGVPWKETSKVPGADKSMNVTVRWDSQDANGTLPMQASCRYLSNEDDAGEDFDVNVEAEYQGVPASMTINGQAVRSQDLYTAIHKVTGQSIKDTANEEHLRKKAAEAGETVKENAKQANQAIREGVAQAREKAGVAAKAIKEGSEQFRQKAGEVLQKAGEQLQK
jgi:hypothetical protein